MERTDKDAAVQQIVLIGSALAGVSVTASEAFAQVVSEEIKIFVNDFFISDLTAGEIILALRQNAAADWKYASGDKPGRVSMYGDFFNVAYLSDILNIYIAQRGHLDSILKNSIDGYL